MTSYVINGQPPVELVLTQVAGVGPPGPTGATGATGAGVPTGGSAGQVLAKIDGTNYNTAWVAAAGLGDMLAANNLSDLVNAATARVNLGLVIGTNVQAYSAVLAATTAAFLTADETKLDGIEAGAQVNTVTATSTTVFTNKTFDSFTNTINADELHVQVRNTSGSTIAKGTPVYISGYDVGQDLAEVSPADSSVIGTMPAIGITEAAISNNATGSVDVAGRISGIDTSAFTTGDELYVSETTGALTATRPTAPAISQQVATVLRSHATLGVIDVRVNAALIPATTTAVGGVELATRAETAARTDPDRAVTPDGLDAAFDAHEAAADPHPGYVTTAEAAAGYQPLEQAVNAQTGTTYTLVAGDKGKLVTLSNAAAITLTLPQDSDATIAVGSYVDLYALGAGQVTVVAGTGATLRTSGLTAKSRAQYARLGVQKVSANTWSLFGDLAAS